MIVIGFETSCDETSVAVVSDGKILSNVIYSQVEIHKEFGGIVPEIASRDHIKKISKLTEMAIKEARITVNDIEAVAVTNAPGLIGALLVGLSFAKGLSYKLSVPFVGVNHLKAHLYSAFLENTEKFPFVGLTVSGGHTNLTYVRDYFDEEVIGTTCDDAAGEAFDKVAKLLGLGYPGGAKLEKLGKDGNSEAISFPRPLMNPKDKADKYNFSFAGLKSSVVNYLRKNEDVSKQDIAASFQAAIIDVLTKKLTFAVNDYKTKNIVISGGVACNFALRKKIESSFDAERYDILIPSPKYCTDNAAMIAYLGEKYIKKGCFNDLSLGATSRK